MIQDASFSILFQKMLALGLLGFFVDPIPSRWHPKKVGSTFAAVSRVINAGIFGEIFAQMVLQIYRDLFIYLSNLHMIHVYIYIHVYT